MAAIFLTEVRKPGGHGKVASMLLVILERLIINALLIF